MANLKEVQEMAAQALDYVGTLDFRDHEKLLFQIGLRVGYMEAVCGLVVKIEPGAAEGGAG